MDTIQYPKSTGLFGELSEPWRLENTLKPMAQSYLDAAATCLRIISPHRLTVGDAYSLYTERLCEAIDMNISSRAIVPATLSWWECENYQELRDVE